MKTPIDLLEEMFGITQVTTELPTVKLPGHGVTITATATGIFKAAADAKTLYYGSGGVVKVEAKDGGKQLTLVPLTPAMATTAFEKIVNFVQPQKPNTGSILNEGMARSILHSDAAQECLPEIRLVANRPIPVLINGEFKILEQGYNAEAKIWVGEGKVEEPETVEEAVEIILEVLEDFEFKSPSDKSRAVAWLLTNAMVRGGFLEESQPIAIVEADESQTGKGYFVNVCCALYGETPIVVTQTKGGVGSLDENLGAGLISGRPFLSIDNVRNEIKSTFLESYLTNSGSMLIRQPYKPGVPVDGSSTLISITSNGLVVTEDLANRAIMIRLTKKAEREFKKFGGLSVIEHIKKNQPKFIGAISKVLRFYHDSGMPETNETRHDRREWARRTDWIVQNIFNLPPLLDGHKNLLAEAQNPVEAFVRELFIQVRKQWKLDTELKASDLVDICDTSGLVIYGLEPNREYSQKTKAQKMGTLMGQVFSDKNDYNQTDFSVVRSKPTDFSDAGNNFKSWKYNFRARTPDEVRPVEPEN